MSAAGGKRRRRGSASPRRFAAPPPWLSVLLLLVTLVFLGTVFVTNRERPGFSWLFRREQHGGSLTTFQEIRDLGQLETLAYVRRSVFPHDFFQPHLTVPGLLRTISAAGTTAAEALRPEELAHLRAANLAASLNLAQNRNDERFVVITTTLVLGYDLEHLTADMERVLSGDTTPADGDVQVYTLPAPTLLAVITENVNRANYPFPAVYLDAEGWRSVTTFVEDHVTVTAPMHELLYRAAENGRDALQTPLDRDRILVQAGTGGDIFPDTP